MFLSAVSLQAKEVDAFSMSGSNVYNQGQTASFKIAASETKSDGKHTFRIFSKYQGKNNPQQERSDTPWFLSNHHEQHSADSLPELYSASPFNVSKTVNWEFYLFCSVCKKQRCSDVSNIM